MKAFACLLSDFRVCFSPIRLALVLVDFVAKYGGAAERETRYAISTRFVYRIESKTKTKNYARCDCITNVSHTHAHTHNDVSSAHSRAHSRHTHTHLCEAEKTRNVMALCVCAFFLAFGVSCALWRIREYDGYQWWKDK